MEPCPLTKRRRSVWEVTHLRDELLALANTRDSNKEYIFAGYQSHTRPFEDVGGSGYAYRGDSGRRYLQIASDRQVADGDNGLDVFMGISTSTGGIRNAFETFDQLSDALAVGASTSEYIDDVQLIMDQILRTRASVGGRLNNIDEQVDVNGHFLLTMQTSKSKEEDLDYAKAITQFEQQILALQAAQKSYARIQELSLFNFL